MFRVVLATHRERWRERERERNSETVRASLMKAIFVKSISVRFEPATPG